MKTTISRIGNINSAEAPTKQMHSVMNWGDSQLKSIGYTRVPNERRWLYEKNGKTFKLWATYHHDKPFKLDFNGWKYLDTDGTIIVSKQHNGVFKIHSPK